MRRLPTLAPRGISNSHHVDDEHQEVRAQASIKRRTLLGSSMGLALFGGAACTRAPEEHIVPHVDRPPELVPGRAVKYATCIEEHGYAIGLLATCHGGRPTKLEGLPDHPDNDGALSAQHQALLSQLYDPDRARTSLHGGALASVDGFVRFWKAHGQTLAGDSGRGLAVLLEPSSSRSQKAAIQALRTRFPNVQLFVDEQQLPHNRLAAARRAYGQPLEALFEFRSVQRAVTFDDDLFVNGPRATRLASQWAARRTRGGGEPARLTVFEPALTPTGALADVRHRVAAGQVASSALALLAELAGLSPAVPEVVRSALRSASLANAHPSIPGVARDLWAHADATLVTAGERQPPQVHLLVEAVGELLMNSGRVRRVASPLLSQDDALGIQGASRLVDALEEGKVRCLFILSDNPFYSLPEGASLRRSVRSLDCAVHLGHYANETSSSCQWFLAKKHALESFGDSRSQDGAPSFAQPLIQPLVEGLCATELLEVLAEDRPLQGRPLLRRNLEMGEDELNRSLEQGHRQQSAHDSYAADLKWSEVARAVSEVSAAKLDLELDLTPGRFIGDGRYANLELLQELPEPTTKLVWDNALLMSPATAAEHGLKTNDVARLQSDSGSIEIPVLIDGTHADGAVSAQLGYGRRSITETVADGVGVDVSPVRSRQHAYIVPSVKLRATGRTQELVRTQHEFSDHARTIALTATTGELSRDPKMFERHAHPPESILADRTHVGPQWAMSIDLSACTGCSACVVACQVENSVPSVGKEQVRLGRAMHWLRIDRYVEHHDHGEIHVNQPMACQHCEKAPCEYVCPVGATTHSPDGLNEMVYNRCVGTRYCSNNCPYKVRRFNYLSHDVALPETRRMQHNPNVTVRARGVMEKCTYCVQRIRRTEIDARLDGRPLADGELQTACQQTCPTRAIAFGDISAPSSKVSRWSASPRAYFALNSLGARPRTRYLARIDHPPAPEQADAARGREAR